MFISIELFFSVYIFIGHKVLSGIQVTNDQLKALLAINYRLTNKQTTVRVRIKNEIYFRVTCTNTNVVSRDGAHRRNEPMSQQIAGLLKLG